MKLKKGIVLVLGMIMIANSSNITQAANNEKTDVIREGTLGGAEIDLSNESDDNVKRILKENGLDYYAGRDYQKLVICEQTSLAGNKKYKG